MSYGPEPRTLPPEGRSIWRLWLYGVLMMAPLLYFVRRYPLPGHIRLSDMGYLSRYGRPEFALYVGSMLFLFVVYVLALHESRRLAARRALPVVFGWGTLMSGVMAWMYPGTAIDVFVYVARSRVFSEHGADPIASYPRDYAPLDPVIRSLQGEYAHTLSPYGPLWSLIAWPVTRLAGENAELAVGGFKLLVILSLLACGWVIALTLGGSSRHEDAAKGVLFLLWNPLVLWEVAGNGHNDPVMVLPILLAFLAWQRRRDAWVLPLIGAAALVKIPAALLLPVAAVAVWRRAGNGGWPARWELLRRTGVLSAVVLAVSFFPFYDLHAMVRSVQHANNIFVVSPANMVVHALRDTYPAGEIKRWLKLAGWVILAAATLWHGLAVWRRPEALLRASFELFYVFLIIVTTYFQGWYLVWPLALVALLPWGWPAWRMIAWSAGAVAVYALFIWVRRLWIPDGVVLLRIGIPLISGVSALLTLAEVISLASRRPTRSQPPSRAGQDRAPGGLPEVRGGA
ncbi:MAG: glycosyltransferase 87 family protein [Chloroflexota bacterium]|nr:glycosyltransferase 87 family protein [Chloroflexota bacterium]